MSSFDTDRGVIILETAQWAVLQRVEDSNPVVDRGLGRGQPLVVGESVVNR